MKMRDHRGTIALEQAKILAHVAFDADQYVLRLHAPVTSRRACPGQFIHLQCAPEIPLRRPLSIMRTDPAGWIEVLYKPVGAGLAALTHLQVQQTVSLLGPIGNGFDWSSNPRHILALGGGVGIPPMIFAAQVLRERTDTALSVYMGSEIPFPFALAAATLETPGVAAEGKSTVALLSEWGVPCVLTSRAGLPGSHDGFVTDLAARSLEALGPDERERTLLLACGPEPMLAAAARLAGQFAVRCQLALEEYMACGVGGCAGCTVEVHTASGTAMQRVCVDGPVFDAAAIYPEAYAI
jgi:dihydroorotate dehydrogenase electron transfer subunit